MVESRIWLVLVAMVPWHELIYFFCHDCLEKKINEPNDYYISANFVKFRSYHLIFVCPHHQRGLI